jgi:ketosteroid isomerase-like protein
MTAGLDAFAAAWIRDWNAHDLEVILDHYAEDVVFRSPKVSIFTEGATDTLRGREALRPYFARGLANRSNLTFSPPQVFCDTSGLALVYESEAGNTACETMTLDADGRVAEARVFYRSSVVYP